MRAVGMDNTHRAFAWIQGVDSEYGSGVDPANASVSGGTLDIDGMQNGDYTVDVYSTSGAGGVVSTFPASATGGTLHLDLPNFIGDIAVKVRPGPPGAPTNVVAAGGDGQAAVSWTTASPPASITGYTVTPRDETSAMDLPPLPVTGTDVTVTGLTNGHAYTFTVVATNAVGTGPSSAPSNEVTPAAGAPPPVVVTEPVDPGGGTVSSGGAPSPTDPVTTEVGVPAGAGGGTVTIAEGTISQQPPVGWQFLGTQIHIDSTASTTANNPLRITFSLDDAALFGETPQTLQVFRTEGNGIPTQVPACTSDPTTVAAPDPCIPASSRQALPGGGGATFTVVTSSASEWNVAGLAPKAVSVTDAGYSPRAVTSVMGQRIQWTFTLDQAAFRDRIDRPRSGEEATVRFRNTDHRDVQLSNGCRRRVLLPIDEQEGWLAVHRHDLGPDDRNAVNGPRVHGLFARVVLEHDARVHLRCAGEIPEGGLLEVGGVDEPDVNDERRVNLRADEGRGHVCLPRSPSEHRHWSSSRLVSGRNDLRDDIESVDELKERQRQPECLDWTDRCERQRFDIVGAGFHRVAREQRRLAWDLRVYTRETQKITAKA